MHHMSAGVSGRQHRLHHRHQAQHLFPRVTPAARQRLVCLGRHGRPQGSHRGRRPLPLPVLMLLPLPLPLPLCICFKRPPTDPPATAGISFAFISRLVVALCLLLVYIAPSDFPAATAARAQERAGTVPASRIVSSAHRFLHRLSTQLLTASERFTRHVPL